MFSHENTIKKVKCTKRAKKIEKEEVLHKDIALYNSNESIHSSISETNYSLKNKIYYTKLKEHIRHIVNNYEKCQRIKCNKKPILFY